MILLKRFWPVLAVIAIFGAGYYFRDYEVRHSPVTSVTKHDSVAVAGRIDSNVVHNIKPVNPELKPQIPKIADHWPGTVDSLKGLLMEAYDENIADEELIFQLSQPKLIPIDLPKVGKIVATFYPIGDSLSWTFKGDSTWRYIDSTTTTRTVESGRAWYEIPVAIIAVVGAYLLGTRSK